MKRCLLLITLLGCAGFTFCQNTDSLGKERDRYSRKGRTEKISGLVALGAGTALTTYAVVEGVSTVFSFIKLKPEAPPKNLEAVAITGEVLMAGGTALLIVGIIHQNKAAKLALTMQKAEALLPAGRVNSFFQPSLTLNLRLSKRK